LRGINEEKKMKHKKAQSAIDGLQSLIIPLVGVALVLTIGFLIFAEAKVQIGSQDGVNATCDNAKGNQVSGNKTSLACNATNEVIDAMGDITGWLPIIVITVIGAILLGLVTLFRRGT